MNKAIVDSRSRTPFRAWDAFDRLFDEAFSRSKTRPLSPDIQYPSPSPYPSPPPYAHAGATPYASIRPSFQYSNESLGFSGPEGDPFEKIWDEGLRKTRRSTVTKSRILKRPKHALETGSNSIEASSSGPSSTPPPSQPPPFESVKSPRLKKRKSKYVFRGDLWIDADNWRTESTFKIRLMERQ
jgi:hypothetical protein